MYNGIVNVYKEKGYTSHDVVAKMRGIYMQKKIGHTGTLDPDAEGVLPVCLGRATKVCDLLTDRNKTYETVLRLGIETDTQDMSGKVLKESSVDVSEDEVREAVFGFIGEYNQVPPMYSALKVNGKKLYELAREGKEVERKARRVEIISVEIENISLPEVKMSITCSKGTYIRTLCHDIGLKLGCGGCMAYLKRTRVGEFEIKNAVKLSEIQVLKEEGKLESILLPIDGLFEDYPAFIFKEEYKKAADNGNRLPKDAFREKCENAENIRVYSPEGVFYGIYSFDAAKKDYKILKMFKE